MRYHLLYTLRHNHRRMNLAIFQEVFPVSSPNHSGRERNLPRQILLRPEFPPRYPPTPPRPLRLHSPPYRHYRTPPTTTILPESKSKLNVSNNRSLFAFISS